MQYILLLGQDYLNFFKIRQIFFGLYYQIVVSLGSYDL